MQKRRWRWIAAVAAVLALLVGWLFLGVYRDRAGGGSRLFIKHRPTLKFGFSAPLGQSDRTLNELAPAESLEEAMYRYYVEEQGGRERSLPLPW